MSSTSVVLVKAKGRAKKRPNVCDYGPVAHAPDTNAGDIHCGDFFPRRWNKNGNGLTPGDSRTIERYEGRTRDRKRQRELIAVVNCPPISGTMTNIQISLECITGYFNSWRERNGLAVQKTIVSKFPTAYASRSLDQAKANLSKKVCLDSSSVAIHVQPSADFYQPLDRWSDQIRLLERVTSKSDSSTCDSLPSFKLVIKSLGECP